MTNPLVAALRAALDRSTPRPGLSRAAVDVLVAAATVSSRQAGEYTGAADDAGDLIGFVVAGIVKVVCANERGTRVTIQFVPPGGFFRLAWPFGPPRSHRIRGVAHVPSVVATVHAEAVMQAIAHLRPTQALGLMACSWQGLSRHLLERSRLITLPVEDRILRGLELLARDFGVAHDDGLLLDLPLTHADLAAFIAASRSPVSRSLAELARARRIAVVDGRLLVRTTPDGRRLRRTGTA